MHPLELTLPAPKEVFRALTGFSPRPWQKSTLDQFVASDVDSWGGTCNIPTGLGKSYLPVMALIASAYVDRPPRRIVSVVDRRIIVDQTHKLVLDSEDRLKHPEKLNGEDREIVTAFRTGLLTNMGLNDPALSVEQKTTPQVHLLRGGTDDRLLQIISPVVPTIILSTIDQAGSRLLMRGYGVSQRAWPIQGGLLAYDAFWIIDEAHTAKILLETMDRIKESINRSTLGKYVGRPFVVLSASATTGNASPIFVPGDDAEAKIANAPKNLTLEILEEKPKGDALALRAEAFVKEALEQFSTYRVAVVCNTINAARSVFTHVTKSMKGNPRQPHVILLIGAIREQERAAIIASEPFQALTSEATPARPVVVIATQTIEIGADFSFDVMLTEIAALDAIIQRAGRVNRRGTQEAKFTVWGHPEPCPVYGAAREHTARILNAWMKDNGEALDFSPAQVSELMADLSREDLQRSCTPCGLPEALVGARVRDLGRTWPKNRGEVDVSWYLHGERAGEVSLVWREDLGQMLSGDDHEEHHNTLTAYVELLPPGREEALTVSTRAARAFLRNNAKSNVSDALDGDLEDAGDAHPDHRKALVIRGDDVSIGMAGSVRAGDTLIVPSSYGWYDGFGFAPGSKEAVKVVPNNAFLIVPTEVVKGEDDDEDDNSWERDTLRRVRTNFAESDDEALVKFSERMKKAVEMVLRKHPTVESLGYVIRIVKVFGCDQRDDSGSESDVSLLDHHDHVAKRVCAYAEALSMKSGIAADLVQAGALHDLGKVDERFQRERLGNDDPTKVLAKSRRGRIGTKLAYRHECGSALMVRDLNPLVCHLCGTHHGYGRPGFPYTSLNPISFHQDDILWHTEGGENLDKVGGWWQQQFAILQNEYSPWGLAYLEALLRLADHRSSEGERKGEFTS